MLRKINSVIRKEDGNDMIEYALLAAFFYCAFLGVGARGYLAWKANAGATAPT